MKYQYYLAKQKTKTKSVQYSSGKCMFQLVYFWAVSIGTFFGSACQQPVIPKAVFLWNMFHWVVFLVKTFFCGQGFRGEFHLITLPVVIVGSVSVHGQCYSGVFCWAAL